MNIEQKMERLYALKEEYKDCQRCPQLACPGQRERKNVVMGSGNPNAGLMLVVDAPHAPEDEEGIPLAGGGGKLLDKVMDGWDMDRDRDVFITQVTACRATGAKNAARKATAGEIKNCLPRLYREVEIVDPFVVLLMGEVPMKALSKMRRSFNVVAGDPNLPSVDVLTKGQCMEVTRKGYVTFPPRFLLSPPNNAMVEGSPLHKFYMAIGHCITLADRFAETYRGVPRPVRGDK